MGRAGWVAGLAVLAAGCAAPSPVAERVRDYNEDGVVADLDGLPFRPTGDVPEPHGAIRPGGGHRVTIGCKRNALNLLAVPLGAPRHPADGDTRGGTD